MKVLSEIQNTLVLIRGAGELATGIAVTLHNCGFNIVMTELKQPRAVRRSVAFSSAIQTGSHAVEDVIAVHCANEQITGCIQQHRIPLLIDSVDTIQSLSPDVYIDARMQKREQDDARDLAGRTIGLGPGFTAGKNCTAAIETKRGHNLGKILWEGSPESDTGIPGNIQGESVNRVIFSPGDGPVQWTVDIGDMVRKGDPLGSVDSIPVITQLDGKVRGLIQPGIHVLKGWKLADVDPRGESVDCDSISDKARAIGRAVLEAVISSSIPAGSEQ